MGSIIIVFSNIENAKKIQTLLNQHGLDVAAVCHTGAQALNAVSQCLDGIVISGYRFSDMYCMELAEYLPNTFEMLLLGSKKTLSECPLRVPAVEMPVRTGDFIGTVTMMLEKEARQRKKSGRKKRDERAENYIRNAKMLLMERNHMTEEEAHRYIQKCSMDTGTNMVETAQMILRLLYEE